MQLHRRACSAILASVERVPLGARSEGTYITAVTIRRSLLPALLTPPFVPLPLPTDDDDDCGPHIARCCRHTELAPREAAEHTHDAISTLRRRGDRRQTGREKSFSGRRISGTSVAQNLIATRLRGSGLSDPRPFFFVRIRSSATTARPPRRHSRTVSAVKPAVGFWFWLGAPII